MALFARFAGGEQPSATKMNETSIPVVTTVADISAPYTGQIVFATADTRLYRCTNGAVPTWAKFSSGPTWSIARQTAQAITSGAWTFVNWDVDLVDTDNMHSTVTNPFAITFTTPGLYAVTAKNGMAPFATPAAGEIRGVRANLNGAVVTGSAVLAGAAGNTFTTVAATPTLFIQAAVNDVLGIEIFHNRGVSLSTSTASAADYPLFTGTWLRD